MAGSDSASRRVLGWRRWSLVSACRRLAQISSWTKSFSCSHGPCSSTTTRNPAVASSLATTPPAAPAPTIRKSGADAVMWPGSAPPHPLAEAGDVGEVVLAVPGVHGHHLVDGHEPAVLRVAEPASAFRGSELPKER